MHWKGVIKRITVKQNLLSKRRDYKIAFNNTRIIITYLNAEKLKGQTDENEYIPLGYTRNVFKMSKFVILTF